MTAAGLLAGFALAGCGLPTSVVVAGYAADGISFGFTGKTVGDHALSEVLDRDCAVWRILNGERICVAWEAEPAGEAADADPGERPELLFAVPQPAAARAEGHVIGGQGNPR